MVNENLNSRLGTLFILKIINARPSGVELGRWLELIFGLHERYIIQYQANRPFTLPGVFKPLPNVRLQGIKRGRLVKQKKRVWARFDEKYPNVIEVEANTGAGHEEPKIFQLTLENWTQIKQWLTPVNKKDEIFHERIANTHKNLGFGSRMFGNVCGGALLEANLSRPKTSF